jgi:uncharacterized protein YodC (DUF2158 family)
MAGEVEFEIGEVVQLKSGGPDMTVAKINRPMLSGMDDDRITVRCQWFGGRKLESGVFDVDELVRPGSAEKKEPKKGK